MADKVSVHADPPPPIVKEPRALSYLVDKQLGKGGFAICYRAEMCENNRPSGKLVALKIVRSKMEPAKLAQKFVTELQLHSKLHHPNIVDFYRAFSFNTSTYVVLELCENGSLADILRKRKYFTMPEIRRFLIQTCGAVKYLHHRNIIHRDLKTGNLFLDKGMNVKVGDFGLAAMLVGKNDLGARRTTMCGTPNYLAPEILEKGGKGHNEKVDLWAIGIIAYTLAVGKAPFHAPKREDIYKKLQNCEYEWPDISMSSNDISPDLKDLVSSLLVHEDDRPVPDKIVSHPFFRISFIPEHLDSSCTLKKPTWNVRPPSVETLRRGYSESWVRLCKASGVGEYASGRAFPLQQAKRIISVVKDVEKEITAGRAPIVPIPADMVYLPYPDRPNWLVPTLGNLSEIAEERESSPEQRLSEISGNGVVERPRKAMVKAPSRLKENVAPQAAIEPPTETHQPVKDVKRALSKRRKVGDSKPIIVAVPPASPKKPSIPSPVEARSTTVRQTSREQEAAEIKPALSRQASRRGKPVRIDSVMLPRAQDEKDARAAIIETAPTSIPTATERSVPSSTIRKVSRTGKSPQLSSDPPVPPSIDARPQRAVTRCESKKAPAQHADSYVVSCTDPEAVLARATQLRNRLVSALNGKVSASKRLPRATKLPFVAKWVDYSRKLGIGYVLNDGSIGCILSATSEYPLTHVVVRNGLAYLYGPRKDGAAGIPLEFYECEASGLRRVTVDAERKKAHTVLWTKFGRYMCQQLGDRYKAQASRIAAGSVDINNNHEEGGPATFVRLYERLGAVGIWGFSDGCFQFNFPDHTKLVVSADGEHCNFTCLSAEAMQYLGTHGNLLYKYIKDRTVLSGAVTGLLHGTAQIEGVTDVRSVTESNGLTAKLEFVVDVVDEWVRAGGLGCSPEGAARLSYAGPCAEDEKNMEWITVGRFGGDMRRDAA